MEQENNKKEKNYIIYIIGVLIIVLLGYFLYVYSSGEDKENKLKMDVVNKENETNSNEAEKIKAENFNAIEKAKTVAIRPVRPIEANDHIWGDVNAPVQLIIYDDFECPFCADFYDTIKEIKEYFNEKVVIAFRHFPLISHPNALDAAMASECAAEQGKFWEMYDELFINNKDGDMSKEQFKQNAIELDLDQAKFNQCLETEKYKNKIQSQILEGRNFGVTGTPGSFLNRMPLPGAYPFEDFVGSDGREREGLKKIIEKQLSKTE